MFSILCSNFKVTFLIYLGRIGNSAMSVYAKYNTCIPNGTANKHFKPNFALQMPVNATSTLKIQSKYQCKLQYFTIKYATYFLTSFTYLNLDKVYHLACL